MPKHNKNINYNSVKEILDLDIELIPRYNRGKVYDDLSKKLKLSRNLIHSIRNPKTATGKRYRNLTMSKITLDIAEKIIGSIYKEYFNKDAEKIVLLHKFEILQIYILPEKIIGQIDESIMNNVGYFTEAMHRIINEAYMRIEKQKKMGKK